jgi:hypothetical protein
MQKGGTTPHGAHQDGRIRRANPACTEKDRVKQRCRARHVRGVTPFTPLYITFSKNFNFFLQEKLYEMA